MSDVTKIQVNSELFDVKDSATAAKLDELIEEIKNSKSHVGMIIQSTTLDTMEKVIAAYGGTAWIKIEGQFLLGASSTYAVNTTGGEATHTLSVSEIPGHTHQQSIEVAGYDGWATGTTSYMQNAGYAAPASRHHAITSTNYATGSNGGGKSHNNMPPYKSVYIWERTE